MLVTDKYENEFLLFIEQEMVQDQAHDINHVLRVVKTAKALCQLESGNLEIVLPAAYLHDCFSFPKNHPNRSQSSQLAADKAVEFLTKINYPTTYLKEIHHAITSHSYSANVKTESLEAKIVQDADRLDALGAIGIARWLQVNSALGVQLYSDHDTFCKERLPDDKQFAIDHFYVKLLNLTESMNTVSAKIEAERRTAFMKQYLQQLQSEL